MTTLDPNAMVGAAKKKWKRLTIDARIALKIAYRQAMQHPEYVGYYENFEVVMFNGLLAELHFLRNGCAIFLLMTFNHTEAVVICDFVLADGIDPYLVQQTAMPKKPPASPISP